MATSTPPAEKQALRGFLPDLFRAIYIFSPSIIFQILYYYIIVGFSIGQDILMQSVESWSRMIATALSVTLWMLFAWFSSRRIEQVYTARVPVSKLSIYTHLPRLLGYNVAVGIQVAALNLPTVSAFNFWQLLIIFAFHNAFYFFLNNAIQTRNRRSITITALMGAIYLFFIILQFNTGTAMTDLPHKQNWFILSILFFLIQIGFVFLVIWRRQTINEQKELSFQKFYNILSLITGGLFLCIVFIPSFAVNFGSFGVVLMGFGLWVGAIYFLRYKALVWKVRFGLLILLVVILFGNWFHSPYKVQLKSTTEKQPERIGVHQYMEKWFARRNQKILQATPDKKYRVYLVTADGGASKSGYWVSSLLSRMQDETRLGGDPFSDHVLSLAGASGGSVGNTAFYTVIQDSSRVDSSYRDEVGRFFSGDFLTYSLARFLSFDIIKHLIPILPIADRTAALEEAMEKLSRSKSIGEAFSKSFHSLVDPTARMPMLFINTTNLETGIPGVISTVAIDSLKTGRIDVMKLAEKKSDRMMKISTAVVLGARFPYISPAGEIDGRYFVDGGYFDNSGAGITLEILQHLKNALNDPSSNLYIYRNHVEFQVIYLSNGAASSTFKELHPLVNDLAAPLLTILNTYGMQTSFANDRLKSYQKQSPYRSKIEFEAINLPYCPKTDTIPYPMNWVISQYNINRMDKNVNEVDLNRIK